MTTNASVVVVAVALASRVAAHLHIEGCTVDVEYERSLGRRAETNVPAARGAPGSQANFDGLSINRDDREAEDKRLRVTRVGRDAQGRARQDGVDAI